MATMISRPWGGSERGTLSVIVRFEVEKALDASNYSRPFTAHPTGRNRPKADNQNVY